MSSKYKVKRKTFLSGFLPDSLKSYIAGRLIDSTGFLFLVSGITIMAVIVTYSPHDPSFNTAPAAADKIHNVLGTSGAFLSDLFLQSLGFASLIFGIIPAIWGLSILKRRSLKPLWIRIISMIAGAILSAIALSKIPSAGWLLHPYMGGSGGTLMLNALAPFVTFTQNPHTFIAILSGILGFMSVLISIAATRTEMLGTVSHIKNTLIQIVTAAKNTIIFIYDWIVHYGSERSVNRPKKQKRTNVKPQLQDDVSENAKIELVKQKSQISEKKSEQIKLPIFEGDWELPALDLLQEPEMQDTAQFDEKALRMNAELLQNVLQDFNVHGEIVSISPGPVVTLYELEPAPGTKTSRVIGLADDIARSMSAVSVRAAVVPGRNVIGIEMPNQKRQIVYMRDMLETAEYQKNKAKLPLILGKDIGGAPIIADLARMPHLLVAGTTGSGKSVAVNTMILSLLYRLPPEKCRFIMIDPKMLELSVYDDIPHLLSPVVTEPGRAVVALKWVVSEMEERYKAMSKLGVRNIEGYNARLAEARKKNEVLMRKVQTGFDPETGKPVYEEQPLDLTELPYIVVIVDEFADLMLVAGKDVENAIQRLAQMARAAGIHLIMATQRPSVDVITGVIKANFPTRVSFAVTSKIDSRTILGEGGAEQLLGMGDMLYMAAGGRIQRVHGPFSSDEDVENVVNFLKSQGEPAYLEDITDGDNIAEGGLSGLYGDDESSQVDALYDQALAIVARERKASTSFIQRHLQIGYNRAARIVEEMERQGVVGPANHVGKREILIGDHSE